MKQVDPSHKRRVSNFSKRIFHSCKNMKKTTRILALSWESQADKEAIIEVLQSLNKLDFIDYSTGFETIKIIVTSNGKLRLNRHNDWYD